MTLDHLAEAIITWAEERGILDESNDIVRQALKVWEESGEIGSALARSDDVKLKDAIGDTFITLVTLAKRKGWSLDECVAVAYDEIKDRKGKMINSVFVKETDLQEKE